MKELVEEEEALLQYKDRYLRQKYSVRLSLMAFADKYLSEILEIFGRDCS